MLSYLKRGLMVCLLSLVSVSLVTIKGSLLALAARRHYCD